MPTTIRESRTDIAAKSVAVVIVTFNRREILRELLSGVGHQTQPVNEIIVVDNASGDGTGAMVREHFPQVTYVLSEVNIGAAGGFSLGVQLAYEHGHGWVWLFNDDNRVEPTTLKRLLASATRLGDGVITCPKIHAITHFCHGVLWRGRPIPLRNRDSAEPLATEPLAVDMVTFNGALLPRSVIDAIGFPRADYFMMFEEWEYCLRAKAAGFKTVVLSDVCTTHLHASKGLAPPWQGYYQTRNHLAMALEHRSPRELFWWTVRQVKFAAAATLYLDYKWRRIGLRLLGAWHGIRGKTGMTIDPTEYLQW
jgi:GT2 family glycosyltransferase